MQLNLVFADGALVGVDAGLEGDVGAVHLAIGDGDGKVRAAEHAARALHAAGELAVFFDQFEELRIAHDPSHDAGSGLWERTPEAGDTAAPGRGLIIDSDLRTESHCFGCDGGVRAGKAGGCCLDGDVAGGLCGLQQSHAVSREGLARGAFVGRLVGGVSVADADETGGAGDVEGDELIGDGNGAALRVLYLDGEHGHVFAVGREGIAIRTEDELCGGAGGVAPVGHDERAVFPAARFDGAGCVLHGPCEV